MKLFKSTRHGRSTTFHSRHSLRSKVLAATLSIAMLPVSVFAAPSTNTNPQILFTVDPVDCPTCTQAQLDDLQDGFDRVYSNMQAVNPAPSGNLCGIRASFARDITLLTYSLVLDGTIFETEWHDYLRNLGSRAGTLSPELASAALASLQESLMHESAGDSQIGKVPEFMIAAQLSRIYYNTSAGIWDTGSWYQALSSPSGGLGPAPDAVLGVTGPIRQAIDQYLVSHRPVDLWRELSIAELADLPESFLVGAIPQARNQLRSDYENYGLKWDMMWNGCGEQLGRGFAETAVREGFNPTVTTEKFMHFGYLEEILQLVGDWVFSDTVDAGNNADPGKPSPGSGLGPLPGSQGNPGGGTGGGGEKPPTPEPPETPETPEEPEQLPAPLCLFLKAHSIPELMLIYATAGAITLPVGGFDLIVNYGRINDNFRQRYATATDSIEYSNFPTVQLIWRASNQAIHLSHEAIEKHCGGGH